MSFNRKAFLDAYQSSESWNSINDLLEVAKSTGGIIDAEYEETALDKALKQDIRSVLNEPDPATGLPVGVSIVGEDGERRYKSPKLFDDSDYKKARDYHYDRAIHHARMVRRFEHEGGIAEQLSLDFGWIDGEVEDAA